jgi:hypothetical protein
LPQAWRWLAWPMPRSIFPTACWPTSAMSAAPAQWRGTAVGVPAGLAALRDAFAPASAITGGGWRDHELCSPRRRQPEPRRRCPDRCRARGSVHRGSEASGVRRPRAPQPARPGYVHFAGWGSNRDADGAAANRCTAIRALKRLGCHSSARCRVPVLLAPRWGSSPGS